jgi:hypothetical protein
LKQQISRDEAWKRGWWWQCLAFCKYDPKKGNTFSNNQPVWEVSKKSHPSFGTVRYSTDRRYAAFENWKGAEEYAAWVHELIRRFVPERRFPPFYLLNEEARDHLLDRLSSTPEKSPIAASIGTGEFLPGYSEPLPSWRLNLNADWKAIAQKLRDWFVEQRQAQGIEKPRSKPGLSWHAPESIDIVTQKFDGYDLNSKSDEIFRKSDSIRKTKEDSVKRARELLRRFKEVWQLVELSMSNGFHPGNEPVFVDYFEGPILEQLRKFVGSIHR